VFYQSVTQSHKLLWRAATTNMASAAIKFSPFVINLIMFSEEQQRARPYPVNSKLGEINQRKRRCLFISVINQLDAQNFCFTVSWFHASTCFEHCCAHHQEVKIALHSLWYHHRYQRLCNTIFTFWWWAHVLETCRGMKSTYCKTKILCIKLVNYWDKYTEMHGQQNVKIRCLCHSYVWRDAYSYYNLINKTLNSKRQVQVRHLMTDSSYLFTITRITPH